MFPGEIYDTFKQMLNVGVGDKKDTRHIFHHGMETARRDLNGHRVFAMPAASESAAGGWKRKNNSGSTSSSSIRESAFE